MKEETPFETRSCYDCVHMVGYVSWWCTSDDAINDRGTRIPGCIHCPHWKPDWEYIDNKFKTPENGYKYTFMEKILIFLSGIRIRKKIVTTIEQQDGISIGCAKPIDPK